MKKSMAILVAGCGLGLSLSAGDIELPKPQMSGGMPLADALAQRKTIRKWSEKPLSAELLSNLLWSAWGVSRPDGRRTAPSALNRQEITLYAALPTGVYRYDATAHKLIEVSTEKFGDAPLTVIFAADLNKQPEKYALVDSGFIGQNIYLFCAANQLATVFRGSFDAAAIEKILDLDEGNKVLFVQAVGYSTGE